MKATPSLFAPRWALIALLLGGCAFAPRKPFTPAPAPADSAAVYFYRPSEMAGRLIRPTIAANGAALGKLPNDSYGLAMVAPGDVELRSTWPGIPGATRDDKVSLKLEAGKVYYLRVRYHVKEAHGLLPRGALQFENRQGLEQVDDAEAVPQMAGMASAEGFAAPAR